jgi:hypothetical protein
MRDAATSQSSAIAQTRNLELFARSNEPETGVTTRDSRGVAFFQ